MVNFNTSPGSYQPAHNIRPTHRIDATDGTISLRFWYVLSAPTSRPFDPKVDVDLVDDMFALAPNLGVAPFRSVSLGPGRDYHLQQLGPNEFLIKAIP